MPRPLPVVARADRPRRSRADREIRLTCPRVSPEYQFRAFVALIKPQLRPSIAHRSGRQAWPRGARKVVYETLEGSASRSRRFSSPPRVQIRPDRENLLEITFDARDLRRARTTAVAISSRLRELWFTFDGRLLHAGRFYRRQGRYRLVPVSMRVPRLPRELFLIMVGAKHAQDDPHLPRKRPHDAA